jgi:hypothetical protein
MFYFPEASSSIVLNTGVLLICDTLQYFEDYIKRYYPDKLLLCDVAHVTTLVAKLGGLGFVSQRLQLLRSLHNNMVGIGYAINSRLLNAASNCAYYSFLFGAVSSFSLWVGCRTLQHVMEPTTRHLQVVLFVEAEVAVQNLLHLLNTSTEMRSVLNTFNTILTGVIEPIQPSIHRTNTKKVFTEEELNRIAPIRCLGFKNTLSITEDTCPICTENYNEKQMHRTLPCSHTFHVHCIDNWLLEKTTVCPVCRSNAYDNIGVS